MVTRLLLVVVWLVVLEGSAGAQGDFTGPWILPGPRGGMGTPQPNCAGAITCDGAVCFCLATASPTRTATPTVTVTSTATVTATATPTPTVTRTPNVCQTAASSFFGVFFGGQYGQGASDDPLCLPLPTVTVSPTGTATRTPTPTPTATGYVMGPQGCSGTDKVYGFNDAGEILCGPDLQAVAPTPTAVTPTPTSTATATPWQPCVCPTKADGSGGAYTVAGGFVCGCLPTSTSTASSTPTVTATPTATATSGPTATATPCAGDTWARGDGSCEQLNLGTDSAGNYAGSASEGGPATTALALNANPAGCAAGEACANLAADGTCETCVTLATPDGAVVVSPTPTPAANQVMAGPTSGGVGAAVWRLLVGSDIPAEIARDSEIPAPYPTPTALAGDVDGAFNATDLDEVAVESELESVLELADLQGAATDAQVDGSAESDEVTMGGDLSGAANTAQLGANVVGAGELASTAIQAGDIEAGDLPASPTPTPAANQVLAGPTSGGVGVATWRALFDADIPASIARDSEIPAPYPTPTQVLTVQVTDTQIADGAVDGGTGGEIADDSITAADLAANAVGASEVADGSLGFGKFADDTVGDLAISSGVPTLVADSVSTTEIAANTIVHGDIADGAVRTNEILDGTILLTDLGFTPLTAVPVSPTPTPGNNQVLAGPTSGGPGAAVWRALFDADIPASIARDAEIPTPVPTPTAPYPSSVEESDVSVGSCQVHDFDGTLFDITISPTGECNYTLSANVMTVSSTVQPSQLSRLAANDAARYFGTSDQVAVKYDSTADAFTITGRPVRVGHTPVSTASPTPTPFATNSATATAATPTIIITPTATVTVTSTAPGLTPVPTATPAVWGNGAPLRRVVPYLFGGVVSTSVAQYTMPVGAVTSTTSGTAFRDAFRGPLPYKGHFEGLICQPWKSSPPGQRLTVTIEAGATPVAGAASQITHTWSVAVRADIIGTRNLVGRDIPGDPYVSRTFEAWTPWEWVTTPSGTGAASDGWVNCTVLYVEDF